MRCRRRRLCPPTRPETDETLTIEPPRRLSSARPCLQPRNVPSRLTARILPPGGEIGFLDVAERREARGVDEAVEPVVGAADLGDHAQPVVLGGDVERVVDALPAGEIAGDRNRRPPRSTASATALPTEPARAGDQNDLVLEPVHAASAALVIVLVVVRMAVVMIVIVAHDHDHGA